MTSIIDLLLAMHIVRPAVVRLQQVAEAQSHLVAHFVHHCVQLVNLHQLVSVFNTQVTMAVSGCTAEKQLHVLAASAYPFALVAADLLSMCNWHGMNYLYRLSDS